MVAKPWWLDEDTWLVPPVRVTMHPSDTVFRSHVNHQQHIIDAVSGLFPDLRPSDLLKSTYADAMRSGMWRWQGDDFCLFRCRELVDIIDSMIVDGFKDPYCSPREIPLSPPWCGPVGWRIDADGKWWNLDGHHRKAIAWKLGLSLPGWLFAVHPQGTYGNACFRSENQTRDVLYVPNSEGRFSCNTSDHQTPSSQFQGVFRRDSFT